jgi:hypothetical protein
MHHLERQNPMNCVIIKIKNSEVEVSQIWSMDIEKKKLDAIEIRTSSFPDMEKPVEFTSYTWHHSENNS